MSKSSTAKILIRFNLNKGIPSPFHALIHRAKAGGVTTKIPLPTKSAFLISSSFARPYDSVTIIRLVSFCSLLTLPFQCLKKYVNPLYKFDTSSANGDTIIATGPVVTGTCSSVIRRYKNNCEIFNQKLNLKMLTITKEQMAGMSV